MAAVALTDLDERLSHLRISLNSTAEGRRTMSSLAPSTMIRTDENIVDFSDWSQFNQWPQSS
jgi:hypothetical protein